MFTAFFSVLIAAVALRKESVDRNLRSEGQVRLRTSVALRKESVDRNINCSNNFAFAICRSPQGERG